MATYRYQGEDYDSTSDRDMMALARELVREECIVDDYDFECYIDEHYTASQVLWEVKEYGYESTMEQAFLDCEEDYVEANWKDIIKDYSSSYEIVDEDAEESE